MRAFKRFGAALPCAALLVSGLAFSAVAADAPAKPAAPAAKSTGPAAVVNGTAISRAEVDRLLRSIQQNPRAFGVGQLPDEASLRAKIVKQLVDRELLYQLSLKHPVKDLKKKADEEFEKEKKSAPSPQVFQERLKQRGITEKDAKALIAKQMSIQEYVKAEIIPQVKVSEADAQKFYNENKAKFVAPEQVRASHILLMVPQAATQDDRNKAYAKAKELQARAAKGEDFAKLARENSQDPGSAPRGGDLGFFFKEQMVPAFSNAAFALKPGQVSEVVQSPYGFHIIKLAERKPPTQQSFEDVKPQLLQFLQDKALDAAIGKKLEEFRKTAKVTIAP